MVIRSRLATQLLALAERLAPPTEAQGETSGRMGPRRVERENVARGLTPARIVAVLREADEGDLVRFASLLDEIEDRDPHIVSVLSTRKRAVANLAWHIEPGGNRAVDRRVAEWVTAKVQGISNLEDGLLDLLDAICKGVAMVEIDWRHQGGELSVASLDYRPQRWFRVDPDDPNQFRLLSTTDPINGEVLTPDRWVVHQSKAKSGFASQAGLGRVLVWLWLWKSYAMKDWASYSELFAAPMRVGRYPAGASAPDIDDLHSALQKLGVDAVATIADDMKVEFVQAAKDGGDTYERLMSFCNREVSKAVLGQTLTTEEGKNGARALGQVHDLVRQDLLESDARQLARTLSRDLVAPLVRFQFGPSTPLPRFVFEFEPPADAKSVAEAQELRAKVFAAARQMGVPVSLAQVQAELDIRPAQGNEATLPLPTPQTPQQDAGAAGATPAGPTGSAVRATDSGPHSCPTCAQAGGRGDNQLALADTPLPSVLAQLDAAVLDASAAGGEAWQALVKALQSALLDGLVSPDELPQRFVALVGALTTSHPQLAAVAEALSEATLTGELIGRAQVAQGERALELLPKVPPRQAIEFWAEKAILTRPEFDQLAAVHRAKAFTIAGWTSIDGLSDAHTALGEILKTGGTVADFEDALDKIAGHGGLSPARLFTVFETNIATAYAVGRDRQQRAPDTLARRPFWRLNTAEDRRVRRTHEAQNGVVRRFDDPYWQVWSPPNGYKCRCFKTAHSAEEVAAAGWAVSDGPQDTDPLTGLAWLPDPGFRTDPARAGQDLSWIRWNDLPPEWAAAVDAEIRGGTP